MGWTEVVRVINVAIALVAFAWLMIDLKSRRKLLTVRRMYLTFSLALFLFAVVLGSLEQILQQVEPGYRMIFSTTACVWTIIALYLGRYDDIEPACPKEHV